MNNESVRQCLFHIAQQKKTYLRVKKVVIILAPSRYVRIWCRHVVGIQVCVVSEKDQSWKKQTSFKPSPKAACLKGNAIRRRPTISHRNVEDTTSAVRYGLAVEAKFVFSSTKEFFPSKSTFLGILLTWFVNPNQYSINSPCTTIKGYLARLAEFCGDPFLFCKIRRILNEEVGVSIYRFNNNPYAI